MQTAGCLDYFEGVFPPKSTLGLTDYVYNQANVKYRACASARRAPP